MLRSVTDAPSYDPALPDPATLFAIGAALVLVVVVPIAVFATLQLVGGSGASAAGAEKIMKSSPTMKNTKHRTTPRMKATIWFSVRVEANTPIATAAAPRSRSPA